MKVQLFLLFFCFSFSVFSQEKDIELAGAIEFEYDNEQYKNKVITNIRTGETTSTNILGQFKIKAQPGDLLEVTGFNIHDKIVEVKPSNITSGVILILVEPVEIHLSAVEGNRFRFSGNLEIDVRNAKQVDSLGEAIKKMGLPIGNERDEWAHLTAPVWQGLSLNIDALNDVITGDRRRKKALYLYNKDQDLLDNIHSYFTDEYFVTNLGIPANEIDAFITTVMQLEPLEQKINQGDYYDVMDILKSYAPIFKARIKIRDYGKNNSEN